MALSRAHPSTKAQQSPLIAIEQLPCRTHPVLWGVTRPSPDRNGVTLSAIHNLNPLIPYLNPKIAVKI